MLPWSFSEEGAAEKHMPQLQHNMWVTASRTALLSIITGGGQWVGNRSAVPTSAAYRREEVLALRREWRNSSFYDAAKAELKKLMPEDAKEAIGHGIRAKRSKSGAVSLDLQEAEVSHAAL